MLLYLAIVSPLLAREDWDDLHPEPHTYYGSEKEAKIKVDAIFWVVEDWEGHYSNELFWIYKHKDYPRFRSTRLFPFYNSLESKIDERSSFFFMPVPGLFYHKRYEKEETRINSTFWLSRQKRENQRRWDLYGLLYYTSREGPARDRQYHHALFPLYYGGSRPTEGSRYSTLLPVYYYETGEKEDYVNLILPVLMYESSSFQGQKRSFHLSPLHYYSHTDWSGDSFERRTFFPAIPLIYANRSTHEESSTNYLVLFHASRDEHSSLYASPLYRIENHRDYGIYWLPFYFQDTREDGYLHIPPLWFSSKDQQGHSNFSPLHYYTESDASHSHAANSSEDKSSSLGFPLIPFLYASRKKGPEESTNYLTLFYSHRDQESSTHISPFYYLHSAPDHRITWLPFYMEDNREDGYFHIPPLWFSDQEPEGPAHFSVLHYYNRDEESTSFGAPLLPVLYAHRKDQESSSTNLLTLIYWAHDRERATAGPGNLLPVNSGTRRKETLRTFNVFPLYFQGFGRDSHLYAVPLYFQDRTDYFFRSWGPLHYLFESETEESLYLPLLPVIYASRRHGDTVKKNYLTFYYTKDGPDGYLRFLPPYYHDHDIVTESTGIVRKDHYNIALLANWNSVNDELQDLILAPVYFWEKGENGHTHVVPFYFEDRNPERKLNFGPLHYFRKDDTTEYLWAALYYSWINKGENPSNGNFMVPFYFNYKDPVKNYHVNLGGISLSEESADVRVNTVAGETKAVSVLDTDIGWLYNLFSYSARIPLQETDDTRVINTETVQDIPEGSQILSVETLDPDSPGEQQPELAPIEEGVSIKRDTSINRENSIRFSGWSVLFGLFARETADTRHHARALPLFWLSWDDASEDQVTVIPGAYMSYDEEPNHYYVLFPLFVPLYATQETPDYSLESYGLFLYLEEEDRVARRRETSIFWPFYNEYEAPEVSGSRLLPVYYTRKTKHGDGKGYDEFSITPLFYSDESAFYAGPDDRNPEYVEKSFYSPLYLSSSNTGRNVESGWSFFPIPFYYRSVEGNQKTENLLLLVHRESELNGPTTHFRFFPFFYYGENYHAFLPLYYYEAPPEGKTDYEDESLFVSPFYWSESNATGSHHRLLWFISWERPARDSAGQDSFSMFPLLFYEEQDHLVLFPVYFSFGSSEDRNHWGPIYYFSRTSTSSDTLVGPVFHSSSQSNQDSSESISTSFHIFPLIFNWWEGSEYTGFYGLLYRHSSANHSRYYIPLIFDSNWHTGSSRSDANGLETASRSAMTPHWQQSGGEISFLLGSNYYRTDHDSMEWGLLYRALMGYESSGTDGEYWNFNLVSFILSENRYRAHRSFLPFYWYTEYGDRNTFHLIPLLTFNFWDDESYTGLHGPLFVEREESYSRNYIPLLYEQQWNESPDGYDSSSGDILLGSLSYESSRDYVNYRAFWNVLGHYESGEQDWSANLLTFVIADRPSGFHQSFLPLYWYEREDTTTDVVIPPLLGWSFKDETTTSEGLGLGLLWYNSKDAFEKEHTRTILLGGLLYYDRYRGKQNGFREWGSVYGFLWDYEVEPRKGFKKFSILKFVFSRVEFQGETKYRVFGIPLSGD